VLQELLHFEGEAGAERFLLDFGHLLNSGAEHAKARTSLKNRSGGNMGGKAEIGDNFRFRIVNILMKLN
jgi:hypothetical protein